MPAVHWIKLGQGQDGPYSGAFRKPRDWNDDGSPMPPPRDRRGQLLRERVPAIGHEGRDISSMRPLRGVKRFADYLRDDGHVAPIVLTNAAAHVPADDNSYHRDRVAKAKYFGWVEWPNRCPCALAAVDELRPEVLMARCNKGPAVTDDEKREERDAAAAWKGAASVPGSNWWGKPCQPGTFGGQLGPCIHLLSERAERRRLRKEETVAREIRSKSNETLAAEKHTEALQELAHEQANLSKTLAATVKADAPKVDKR